MPVFFLPPSIYVDGAYIFSNPLCWTPRKPLPFFFTLSSCSLLSGRRPLAGGLDLRQAEQRDRSSSWRLFLFLFNHRVPVRDADSAVIVLPKRHSRRFSNPLSFPLLRRICPARAGAFFPPFSAGGSSSSQVGKKRRLPPLLYWRRSCSLVGATFLDTWPVSSPASATVSLSSLREFWRR